MQFFPTTDEDFQYFRAQGYTGSINDMHFKAMGDLGNTGALTDRIHSFLGSEYGSYHEAMRDLRNSAASFVALRYGVDAKQPPLTLDFAREYFRTGGNKTTLDAATTYTGASNSTMVDSDGLLKWAPHNFVRSSQDLSSADWIGNGFVTADQTLAPDNSLTGNLITFTGVSNLVRQATVAVSVGQTYTTSIWVKAGTSSSVTFTMLFSSGGLGTVTESLTLTSEWQLFTLTGTVPAGTPDNARVRLQSQEAGTIYAWGVHVYRSDLGGMVNNPDTGDSYVPTTSAAVYLPRVGNHVYNGTSYVNEGLFLESEARTNLFAQSNDFSTGSTVGSVVVDSTASSPDGGTTAASVTASAGTSEHYVSLPYAVPATVDTYALSFYVKAGTSNYATVTHAANAPGLIASYIINLSDGSITQTISAGDSVTVEDAGNGWWRITTVDTSNGSAGSGGNFKVGPHDASGGVSWVAAGTEVIYVYGGQLEIGSASSSYIPTAGSTVTRAAQTLTVAAANMPWPTPVALEPELIDNGTFDTDTGWNKSVGWTIGSGVASCDGTTGDIFQVEANRSGTYVQITFTISNYVSGSVAPAYWNPAQTLGTARSANGTYTELLFITNTGSQCGLRSASFVGDVDNFSVKLITSAVSIQMDGMMSYADTGNTVEVKPVNWLNNATSRIFFDFSTSGAATGQMQFRQNNGTLYSVPSASDAYSPDINVPFNIASRHGSTFINGAVDGTALTADLTPTALPDLSATDFLIGTTFMGNIGKVRVWADDIGDTGIAEAST